MQKIFWVLQVRLIRQGDSMWRCNSWLEHQCTAPSLGLYFTAVITLYQVGLSKNGPNAGSNSDIIFGALQIHH